MYKAIQEGVGGAMPAANLPEDQAWQVVAFVVSLTSPAIENPISGDVENGRTLFIGKGGCANCHAINMTFPAATDAAACIELELSMLTDFVTKGVTPREVTFMKKFLGRSHAFDIDTATKRLHQALDVELLALPADYYDGYVGHVEGVQPEAANASIPARLSPANLRVVVVGTKDELFDKVKEKIPDLEQADVVPFDAE